MKECNSLGCEEPAMTGHMVCWYCYRFAWESGAPQPNERRTVLRNGQLVFQRWDDANTRFVDAEQIEPGSLVSLSRYYRRTWQSWCARYLGEDRAYLYLTGTWTDHEGTHDGIAKIPQAEVFSLLVVSAPGAGGRAQQCAS